MSNSSQNKMAVNNNSGNFTRLRTKKPKMLTVSAQKERNLSIKKVSMILQKDESMRTKEEKELLFNYSEIVKEAGRRIERRRQLKERLKEIEDSEAVLDAKCKRLADAISKSENLVVYTGAGISTAARIPDYRGASGIWTLLQQGKDIGTHDLTQADPTFTHMALFQLYSQGKLKHIVSQNCDGLHLRSGLPKRALSEVHGNMYIEVCKTCKPIIEYLRLFDVTENTGRYSHRTMRKCYKCNSSLVDSIVHFGERGNLPWPLNWKGACKAAEKADMILCIGSSLKVLKRYPWLWCMDKPIKRRPDIYIVNLQWTPKDGQATIKINGKCDVVMEKLMKYLSINVPKYSRKDDPIFGHATDLCKEEVHTKNRPLLTRFKREASEVKAEPCDSDSISETVKKEPCDYDTVQKIESEESCVTTCKKEIVFDPGEGDIKCVKEELILITIRSGGSFKDCCSLFRINQTHEHDCPNFIDEKNDIPVIIEDDLVVLKNKSGIPVKIENLITTLNANGLGGNVTSEDLWSKKDEHNCINKRHSNPDSSVLEAESEFGCKRLHSAENSESDNKKLKLSDDNCRNKNNLSLSVLESKKQSTFKKESKSSVLEDCEFCRERYSSNRCLFYVKRKPFFKENVPTCDCCSSDEDEGEETSDEKVGDMQVNTNPGWYGKGLRKNIRKKRFYKIPPQGDEIADECSSGL